MINFNGNIVEDANLNLSSNNRALNYGDGVFDTIKVKNGTIHFLEDHYFRLMASLRMLRMTIPMEFTLAFFKEQLTKTVVANNFENARVKLIVFRKEGGKYTPVTNEIDFLISAEPLIENLKKEYEIDIFKDYYISSGLLSTIKTTSKITNVLASIYANENDFDNCILLNQNKNVVEAINGNVFLVFGNTIKTPKLADGCIKGIIRKKIIEIISKLPQFELEETQISPFDLQKADEIFITNAIVEIQPVSVYKKNEYKKDISELLSKELKKLVER
ncbi:aminotransferase class IV [Lutibacter sp.]|uniref:aminotransferase class IV n=1 Tax=Lutibacter sp. TaxID=1925666 RepID=UPI0027324C07|nr:aminotransferase class IV [Lutibacter sp.]MDP3313064.1 aminotransferase class IV [Lutibacter sp.]